MKGTSLGWIFPTDLRAKPAAGKLDERLMCATVKGLAGTAWLGRVALVCSLAWVWSVSGVRGQTLDYGDAPSPYPTKQAEGGASHVARGPRLGSVVDIEPDGQPDAQALGDDLNPVGAPDDEDGVTFLTPLIPGQVATVQIVIGGTGFQLAFVDAWIDFNRNGNWNDSGEQVFSALALGPGTHIREFNVPSSAVLGPTYARFRVASQSVGTATGRAGDGEVEDY